MLITTSGAALAAATVLSPGPSRRSRSWIRSRDSSPSRSSASWAWSRTVAWTSWPAWASSRAVANPIPCGEEQPVIRTTLLAATDPIVSTPRGPAEVAPRNGRDQRDDRRHQPQPLVGPVEVLVVPVAEAGVVTRDQLDVDDRVGIVSQAHQRQRDDRPRLPFVDRGVDDQPQRVLGRVDLLEHDVDEECDGGDVDRRPAAPDGPDPNHPRDGD